MYRSIPTSSYVKPWCTPFKTQGRRNKPQQPCRYQTQIKSQDIEQWKITIRSTGETHNDLNPAMVVLLLVDGSSSVDRGM
jgi:hypothetical protein